MARRCDLTGKGVQVGCNVSHSHVRTKRRFLPNLGYLQFFSASLNRKFRFRASMHALRSVDHCGGLDAFLIKANPDQLSPTARRVRREIKKAIA